MSVRRDNTPFLRIQKQLDFEKAIVQAYKSGSFLTKQIASTYGISPRSVQRIVKKWGAARTQAEGNQVAGPLGPRHRIRKKGKSKENQLANMRVIVIAVLKEQGRDFSMCELCRTFIPSGKYQLHHTKYDGATIKDLKIVCQQCNLLPENQYLD